MSTLDDFDPAPPELALPSAVYQVAPSDPELMADLLTAASDAGAVVVPWGGGVHQGLGYRVAADVVASTANLNRIIAWEPEDLTVVVEAGVTVDTLESQLATRHQTAALVDLAPGATVGGTIAAGVSGYRRLRFGPARDRILQATVVTGDGRVVTAGGRVVKNVSGYDIQRSIFGAHGALGIITSVCLKLWPRSSTAATVTTDDPLRAMELYRPLAILQTETGSMVYLEGAAAQVDADAGRLGGQRSEGLGWPEPPLGAVTAAVTVPPAEVPTAVERVVGIGPFVAQHGVGRIDLAGPEDSDWIGLRNWAESVDGRLTITGGPDHFYSVVDPWGSDPPAVAVQRRLVAAFDPMRTINRGRLPGGI